METIQLQALKNAENARIAFLELSTSQARVLPAKVFAAQWLVRQTQEAVRTAFRV